MPVDTNTWPKMRSHITTLRLTVSKELPDVSKDLELYDAQLLLLRQDSTIDYIVHGEATHLARSGTSDTGPLPRPADVERHFIAMIAWVSAPSEDTLCTFRNSLSNQCQNSLRMTTTVTRYALTTGPYREGQYEVLLVQGPDTIKQDVDDLIETATSLVTIWESSIGHEPTRWLRRVNYGHRIPHDADSDMQVSHKVEHGVHEAMMLWSWTARGITEIIEGKRDDSPRAQVLEPFQDLSEAQGIYKWSVVDVLEKLRRKEGVTVEDYMVQLCRLEPPKEVLEEKSKSRCHVQ